MSCYFDIPYPHLCSGISYRQKSGAINASIEGHLRVTTLREWRKLPPKTRVSTGVYFATDDYTADQPVLRVPTYDGVNPPRGDYHGISLNQFNTVDFIHQITEPCSCLYFTPRPLLVGSKIFWCGTSKKECLKDVHLRLVQPKPEQKKTPFSPKGCDNKLRNPRSRCANPEYCNVTNQAQRILLANSLSMHR